MLSIFDQGPFAPCPAPFNLAAHVLRHAARLGSKTALSVLEGRASQDWSYARLEAAVRGTGTGLLAAGLKPGSLVLMRLGNTVEFPIAYLGAIAAGLVPVPTSAQLTEPETARMIADLNPAAVLRDPGVPCASHPLQISTAELMEMRDLPPCDYDFGDPERLAYVVYTSGTSGNPRAVAVRPVAGRATSPTMRPVPPFAPSRAPRPVESPRHGRHERPLHWVETSRLNSNRSKNTTQSSVLRRGHALDSGHAPGAPSGYGHGQGEHPCTISSDTTVVHPRSASPRASRHTGGRP